MIKYLKHLLVNPFFHSSLVMIVGSNFANFINYIYHTIMGRILGPANYSELAAVFSIINLIGVITVSSGLVVTKFVSSAKNEVEIKRFLGWLSRKIFYISLSITILFIVAAITMKNFLNLSSTTPLILMSLTFVFSFPLFINRAVFQGLLRFKESTGTLIVEHSLKLFIGVILVFLGFSVSGAVFGVLIASICAWVMTRYLLRNYVNYSAEKFKDVKPLFLYTIPVFIQSLTLASINSLDLVLVKHFFSAHEAGIYASVSTLGKIIFFGTGPVTAVMFPMIAQKKAQQKSYTKIFLLSLLLTICMAGTVLAIFGFLPNLAVFSLFGQAYFEASKLLFGFGIFMTFYTLSYLLINFYLSVGKTKIVILPAFAAITQIIGIWIYHNSLVTVININIGVAFILLFLLSLFYLKDFVLKNANI